MTLGIQAMLGKIRLLPQKDPNFNALVENLLGLGLDGTDKTRSHVNHALGTVQEFLSLYPQHKQTIKNSSKIESFPITNSPAVLADWIQFIQSQHGPFGPNSCYNYDIQKNILPVNLGGNVTGGGAGGDEFKKVLRLLAEIF